MKSKKPYLVYITVQFEYPCTAGDEVEAEMMARHMAAGDLGNTPLLGVGMWSFNAELDKGEEKDAWAV